MWSKLCRSCTATDSQSGLCGTACSLHVAVEQCSGLLLQPGSAQRVEGCAQGPGRLHQLSVVLHPLDLRREMRVQVWIRVCLCACLACRHGFLCVLAWRGRNRAAAERGERQSKLAAMRANTGDAMRAGTLTRALH